MEETLIPIAVFTTFIVIIWLILRYQYKTRKLYLDTFRDAMSNGEEINPELVQSITQHTGGPQRDMRWGSILLALAIAICLAGLAFNFPSNRINPFHLALGAAAFPGLLGAAYLMLAFFNRPSAD